MAENADRLLHAVYRGCGYLAGVFIVVIAILMLINMGSRLIGAFAPGMTESAGYCMAAAGSLGLAYTFGAHGHIRVTMLVNKLRGRARFGLEMLSLLIATGLVCYLAFYVCRMVYISYIFDERSDGSDELFIYLPQIPMAIGFTIFAIALVHAVVKGIAAGEIPTAGDKPEDAAGH